MSSSRVAERRNHGQRRSSPGKPKAYTVPARTSFGSRTPLGFCGNCSPERPLVILAFDEARILNDIPTGQGWSLFSELRRVLRQLDRFSIFPLFLSMNEEFRVFDQEVRSFQEGSDPQPSSFSPHLRDQL